MPLGIYPPFRYMRYEVNMEDETASGGLTVEMLRANADGRPALFVMTLPPGHSPMLEALRGVHNHWDYLWAKQGVTPSPGLLVLHHGATLEAVGAAQLAKLGLMRIPTPWR